jgi:clan AA aspartic protease
VSESLESNHYPYLPLTLLVRDRTVTIEALIDTGFDGYLAVPPDVLANGAPPDDYHTWRLADGSEVVTPVYVGRIQLGDISTLPVIVIALGDAPIVGRGIIDNWKMTFFWGRSVVVEP